MCRPFRSRKRVDRPIPDATGLDRFTTRTELIMASKSLTLQALHRGLCPLRKGDDTRNLIRERKRSSSGDSEGPSSAKHADSTHIQWCYCRSPTAPGSCGFRLLGSNSELARNELPPLRMVICWGMRQRKLLKLLRQPP